VGHPVYPEYKGGLDQTKVAAASVKRQVIDFFYNNNIF
jgi:hypothetical protein